MIKNILFWILSVFFLIFSFSNLSTSWASILFLVPAVLFNPIANKFLHEKLEFNNRWWVKLCAALAPAIIFAAVAPQTEMNSVPTDNAISDISVSSEVSENQAPSSEAALAVSSKSVSSSTAVAAPAPSSGEKLEVHYIDVGQGDSEFVELPNGQTILIDAGNPENGSQIISYIKGLGHNKIDYLVATHPHADHIGGMADVVNGLNIGSFYAPKVTTTTQTYKDLVSALQSKKLGIHVAKAGLNMFKAGNLSADIVAPANISGDDLNQYSAVIMLKYGSTKFLFTGDAGEPSESQIAADVKADVLKVGHHGSNTSTSQAFLNKVHPKYAVIEVGKDNSYGHPTAATLSKLQNIGAAIYRTDNDGTIIFTSDAQTITVNKKSSSVKQQAPPSSTAPKKTTTTPKKAASSKPKVVAPSTQNKSVTVYITDTGKKYHRDGCRYLKKSKHAISLKNAKAEGYTPCSVCDPPQ